MNKLISYYEKNKKLDFNATDSQKSFHKCKRNLGDAWEYANKEVSYQYNECGFRTKSFDLVNWNESIVMLGCSMVEGIGLAESDTIAVQLENILEIPVINLGLGGTAVDLACWNSLILHEHYPHPRAIVQIWTGLDRYTDTKFVKDTVKVSNLLPHDDGYKIHLNWENRSKFYIKADRALWNGKTRYYEGTFFNYTEESVNVDAFHYVDKARDFTHPGVITARQTAETIAENLKKQGI